MEEYDKFSMETIKICVCITNPELRHQNYRPCNTIRLEKIVNIPLKLADLIIIIQILQVQSILSIEVNSFKILGSLHRCLTKFFCVKNLPKSHKKSIKS